MGGTGAGTGFSACCILCWFAHKLPSVGFMPELLIWARWGGGVVKQSQQCSLFQWMSACALLKTTVGLLAPKARMGAAVPTSSFHNPSAKSSERLCPRKFGVVAAFPWRSLVTCSSAQHISMGGTRSQCCAPQNRSSPCHGLLEKSTGCCRVVKNILAVVEISSMCINTGGEKHPNG